MAQGVPGHIGTPSAGYGYEAGDPYGSFLPHAVPVCEDDADVLPLRAVVIVREGTEKVGQEYVRPLLVLSGSEYAAMAFEVLHDRICDVLRGNRPRVLAQVIDENGEAELIFDDTPPPGEPEPN
jgi:hypothetical protein